MSDWLAAAAERTPGAPAVFEFPTDRGTGYRALNFWASLYAAWLAIAGVQRGDCVGLLANSSWQIVALIHALARLGAVLVPLNLRLTPDELLYQVEAAGCKMVLCDSANKLNALALRSAERKLFLTSAATRDEDISPLPGLETWTWQNHVDGEIDLDAVQSIVFTSGTTGKPKGAQITFGNLYASAIASAERLGASPDDRWLCALPFYHVGGLSILFRSAIYGSAAVLPQATNTEGIIKGLHDSQATIVSLVPTQLYRMLEAGFEPPKSLRLILLGGAAATPELVASLH